MAYNTLYNVMSPQDKLAWLTDFTEWRNEKLPLLCCAGNAWNSTLVAMFDEGLDLISVFAYTADFVAKSRLFRDYARRVPRLSYYVDKILREIIATTPVPTASPEPAAPQPRRRGRPTKAESAAMEQQRAEAARAEVAARLIHDPLRAMAEQTTAPQATQGDLFGATPAPKAPSSSLAATLALSGGKLHIDQLAWLLSADLRERTTHIAELRAVAAAESNQAKELADRGVPEAVIQPHTAAAIKATNDYKSIYADIDRELGTMYAQLTSGKHTEKYQQLCQSRGITTAQLADLLLPYWEKIGSPAASSDEPAAPTAPESAEEKRARQLRLHSIRTYFTRRDRIMKPSRIAKMREMIDELRSYGLPTEEYEAMLAKAEEEVNDNVNVDDNDNDNENS